MDGMSLVFSIAGECLYWFTRSGVTNWEKEKVGFPPKDLLTGGRKVCYQTNLQKT